MITTSAPGKLVLSGEYAVLAGGPAMVTAVDRRARVRIEPSESCRVTATGHEASPAGFEYQGDGRLQWSTGTAASDYGLVGAVLATLADRSPLPPGRSFHLGLDTSLFYDGASKLGLGSSAALSVAATAALAVHFDIAFESRLAFRSHRELQGGAGSGLDVATSLAGGLICFEADGEEPLTTPCEWPAGLETVFVWTGRPAATTPRIRRFETWRDSDRHSIEFIERLCAGAAGAARAWQAGEAGRVVESTAAWAALLEELAEVASIDIWGGGHAELLRFATAAGIAYKPSGAGGGDLGMAVSEDREALAEFSVAASDAGFCPLALRPDARGLVTVE